MRVCTMHSTRCVKLFVCVIVAVTIYFTSDASAFKYCAFQIDYQCCLPYLDSD